MYEHLKGETSFWYPYISVMNEADLACFWTPEEIDELNDFELKIETKIYFDEVNEEWKRIEKVLKLYPEKFPGLSKELFV